MQFEMIYFISSFMKGIITTWKNERFESVSTNGNRWPKWIYLTINGGNDQTCAMHCHLSNDCIYYVFYNGNCYLGDCSVTAQTLSNQNYATAYFKSGNSQEKISKACQTSCKTKKKFFMHIMF